MLVALGHLDGGDGRALEGSLVDGGDRGRQRHRASLAPGEGARADGRQGVLGAVVGDGLGKNEGVALGIVRRRPLRRGRRRSCP